MIVLFPILASVVMGLLGYWLGLRHAHASRGAVMDAARLSVAGIILFLYAGALTARIAGVTPAEPPLALAAMLGCVVVWLFPKSFFTVSREGFSVGGPRNGGSGAVDTPVPGSPSARGESDS